MHRMRTFSRIRIFFVGPSVQRGLGASRNAAAREKDAFSW